MHWWEIFKDWFLSLGNKYNVNPYIFGSIYFGAIPVFFFFLSRTIKNIKSKKSYAMPLLLTCLSFISAYLYLIIAGKNIPVWVYIFISMMILYGVFSTIKKIRTQR